MTQQELDALPENGGIDYREYTPDETGTVTLENGKTISGLTGNVQVPFMRESRALYMTEQDGIFWDNTGSAWLTGIDPATGTRYKTRMLWP